MKQPLTITHPKKIRLMLALCCFMQLGYTAQAGYYEKKPDETKHATSLTASQLELIMRENQSIIPQNDETHCRWQGPESHKDYHYALPPSCNYREKYN